MSEAQPHFLQRRVSETWVQVRADLPKMTGFIASRSRVKVPITEGELIVHSEDKLLCNITVFACIISFHVLKAE